MFKIFLLKTKFLYNLLFLNNIRFFLFKKKIFFYIKKKFIINLFLCLDCHNNINYNLYPELFKIPIIKNQNLYYIINSINNYKFLNRKSIYMNFISKYLNNLDILKLSQFFCFKNEKYQG